MFKNPFPFHQHVVTYIRCFKTRRNHDWLIRQAHESDLAILTSTDLSMSSQKLLKQDVMKSFLGKYLQAPGSPDFWALLFPSLRMSWELSASPSDPRPHMLSPLTGPCLDWPGCWVPWELSHGQSECSSNQKEHQPALIVNPAFSFIPKKNFSRKSCFLLLWEFF